MKTPATSAVTAVTSAMSLCSRREWGPGAGDVGALRGHEAVRREQFEEHGVRGGRMEEGVDRYAAVGVHEVRAVGVDGIPIDGFDVREMAGHAQDGVSDRRVELLHERQQAEADEVAPIDVRGVRAVGAEG